MRSQGEGGGGSFCGRLPISFRSHLRFARQIFDRRTRRAV